MFIQGTGTCDYGAEIVGLCASWRPRKAEETEGQEHQCVRPSPRLEMGISAQALGWGESTFFPLDWTEPTMGRAICFFGALIPVFPLWGALWKRTHQKHHPVNRRASHGPAMP